MLRSNLSDILFKSSMGVITLNLKCCEVLHLRRRRPPADTEAPPWSTTVEHEEKLGNQEHADCYPRSISLSTVEHMFEMFFFRR